jgi:hypothetical protein
MILNETGRQATAGTPGVVDTSGNFSTTGVVDTGGKSPIRQKICHRCFQLTIMHLNDKSSQFQIVVILNLDNGTALLLSAGVAVSGPCRNRLQPGLRKSSQVICSIIFIGFQKGGR